MVPQIDRILEKGLVSLSRLQSLEVESAVEWYNTLQKTLMIYLVPITPLDCVMIKMGYEALCIPGTGLTRYPVAACVLLEILPRLLPNSDNEVSSIINMVRMESNNGYDLLWRILELTVPGFDPTFPVKIPTWSEDGIFDFAHAFQLYYRLLSKKGDFHNDKTRLLKGPDWDEWQSSEYLQLNQYQTQGMFGIPTLVDEDAAVFHTVWTYGIKALDARKKAPMICGGSLRAGQAHVLHTCSTL